MAALLVTPKWSEGEVVGSCPSSQSELLLVPLFARPLAPHGLQSRGSDSSCPFPAGAVLGTLKALVTLVDQGLLLSGSSNQRDWLDWELPRPSASITLPHGPPLRAVGKS